MFLQMLRAISPIPVLEWGRNRYYYYKDNGTKLINS